MFQHFRLGLLSALPLLALVGPVLDGADIPGGVGIVGELFVDYANMPSTTTGAAYRVATNALVAFSGSNHYYNVSSRYARAGGASRIQYDISTGASSGAISFLVAPSGVAGDPIAFLQAATILNNGNVGIGTTTPTAKLEVTGDVKNSAFLRIGKVGATPSSFGDWVGIDFVHTNEVTPISQQTGNPAVRMAAVLERGNNGYGLALSTRSDAATLNEVVRVNANGKVGVGTIAPTRKLQVYSTDGLAMKIENNGTGNAVLEVQADQDAQTAINFCRADGASMGQVAYYQGAVNNYMTLRTNSLERMRIDSAGNIGIGTTTPTNALTVNGTISAKEIKVSATGADYVFEDGYRLRPLAEVERFIKDNRHLPEISPAKQMQEEGMGVAEVVTKQLAKIEELTLYAIEAKRERDAMAARLQALEDLVREKLK